MSGILSDASRACNMGRTTKGRKRFAFRITIVPAGKSAKKDPWIGTHKWKHRAIYNMKMKLFIQIEKASIRARYKWEKFYSVRGYGAPGRLEFICPFSGMVASTINPEEAASFRRYWFLCASKSAEILEWLNSLDPQMYSARLNSYLLKMIVITYNMREMQNYKQLYPFEGVK